MKYMKAQKFQYDLMVKPYFLDVLSLTNIIHEVFVLRIENILHHIQILLMHQ